MPSSWGDLNPGTEPGSLRSPAPGGGFFTTSTIWEASYSHILHKYNFVCFHRYLARSFL